MGIALSTMYGYTMETNTAYPVMMSCVLCLLPCQHVGNGYFATRHRRLPCLANELQEKHVKQDQRAVRTCTYWLVCNFHSFLDVEIRKSTIDQLRTQGSHSSDLQGKEVQSRKVRVPLLVDMEVCEAKNPALLTCVYIDTYQYRYRNMYVRTSVSREMSMQA